MASVWSMMPSDVVSTMWPNCADTREREVRRNQGLLLLLLLLLLLRGIHGRRGLTWRDGSRVETHLSTSTSGTSKRGLMAEHLFRRPFSSTTILPERWSSTISNSPM